MNYYSKSNPFLSFRPEGMSPHGRVNEAEKSMDVDRRSQAFVKSLDFSIPFVRIHSLHSTRNDKHSRYILHQHQFHL